MCYVCRHCGCSDALEKRGIKVIEDDFIDIKMGYVRHDAEKIAFKLTEIYDNRDLPLLCNFCGEDSYTL